MPENEFEKQVQQKMNELQFIPSHATWQKVEKEIAGRRKRKPVVVWLFLFFLLTGGAAWMYYSTAGTANEKHPVNKISVTGPVKDKQANAAAVKAPEKKESKQIFPGAINTIEKRRPEKHHPGAAIEGINQNSGAIIKDTRRKDGLKDNDAIDGDNTIYGNGAGKNTAGTTQKNTSDARGATHRKNILVDNGTVTGSNLPLVKSIAKNIPPASTRSAKTGNNEPDQPITDTITMAVATVTRSVVRHNAEITITGDPAGNILPVNKSAATKSNSYVETNKMEWGISVRAGISDISNRGSVVQSGIPGTYTSSNNLNNLAAGPSAAKPGAAFAAGIIASKTLNKNYRLLAALHYSYVSTRIETGAKNDSNRTAIQYHTGNTAVFTNRFYFVELPVTIQKQLGIASHFSVDGGLDLSMLSGSRALQYNQQKDIYEIDNSHINRMQLCVLAGFNYRLLQKSFSIETGPQFNCSLTNIFEKQVYGSRHLFFAGISTKIFFFRKNKR